MSNFFRKVERNKEKKKKEAFQKELVSKGKKVIYNFKTEKIEIVDAQKPYRKEK